MMIIRDTRMFSGDLVPASAAEEAPVKKAGALRRLGSWVKANPKKAAGLGLGAAALAGGAYALAKRRKAAKAAAKEEAREFSEKVDAVAQANPEVKKHLLAKALDWVKANPKKAAGIGIGTAALGAGAYALSRRRKARRDEE